MLYSKILIIGAAGVSRKLSYFLIFVTCVLVGDQFYMTHISVLRFGREKFRILISV